MTQLTEHFTLEEFTFSQTASREGIPNVPDATALANLKLCAETMEKVRTLLHSQPIFISSGYRGPQLNAAIGGSTTSAHMYGLAADFTCPGFGTPHAICKALQPHMAELRVDQLIYEYEDWVHLGVAAPGADPRVMALTINSSGTTTGIA